MARTTRRVSITASSGRSRRKPAMKTARKGTAARRKSARPGLELVRGAKRVARKAKRMVAAKPTTVRRTTTTVHRRAA